MNRYNCYACDGDFHTGYWLHTGPGRDVFYCDDCGGIIDHAVRHDDEPAAWLEDRQYISEATAFDHGDEFESVAVVREYFTVENLEDMFGSCRFTQEQLDLMAEAVIEHGWHMVSRSPLGSFLREWRGYRIYEPSGEDPDPNVLVVVDQDGNRARFDAGDREWEDFDDLLGLLADDLAAGTLWWREGGDAK